MKFLRTLLLPLLSILLASGNQVLIKLDNPLLGVSSNVKHTAKTDGNAGVWGKPGGSVPKTTTRAPKVPFSELSTEDAVKRLAQKAQKAIQGEGMHAGRDKHNYVRKLMDTYKEKFKGHPGVEFEETVKNTERGLKGRLDVIDNPNKVIYDFKFGKTGMSEKQLAKYRELKPGYTIKVIDKAGKIIAEHAPQNN